MDSDLALSHEKLFGEIMSKIEEIAIPFVGWVKLQDNEDEVSDRKSTRLNSSH